MCLTKGADARCVTSGTLLASRKGKEKKYIDDGGQRPQAGVEPLSCADREDSDGKRPAHASGKDLAGGQRNPQDIRCIFT